MRPDGIANHLLAVHKIFAKARKPYLEYATSLDIVSPADVQDPKSGGPPIQGLRLHDGQVCRVCGYITTGKKYIEKHANQEHGWVKKQGRQWDIKPVQTFFINNKTRYFIVASAEEQQMTLTIMGTIRRVNIWVHGPQQGWCGHLGMVLVCQGRVNIWGQHLDACACCTD